jgi:hypothetical protein
MSASDDCNETRNSEDVTEDVTERKIQKDLLWGLYQDVRTHARHNETIRSNAVNYMLLGASALIVVITYDRCINGVLDNVLAIILSLFGLIGIVFATSYAELYYRNRAKSGRLLQELDTLVFQDQESINLSDIFPEASRGAPEGTERSWLRRWFGRKAEADYEYERKLHLQEYEYRFKWTRRITGRAGSTHVFWILLPFVVFLIGIVLTAWGFWTTGECPSTR